MAKLSALVIFMAFGSSCNQNNSERTIMDKGLFAYDLNNPDAKYKLPSYLEEISGLSYYGKDKIACIQDEKAKIYIMSLEKEKLIKTPHILIDLERLDSYIDHNVFTKLSIKVAKRLGLIESETSFKPSGIAIHPLHGEIYIISSVGKLLIILNSSGKVLDVQELEEKFSGSRRASAFHPPVTCLFQTKAREGRGIYLNSG